MYFGLKEQIISFLVKLNREIVSKYCNLSQTQRGIHQLPFMPPRQGGGGGHLTVRFDTKVSRYLEECREVEKKIADVKDSIKEYQVSLTLYCSHTLKPFCILIVVALVSS